MKFTQLVLGLGLAMSLFSCMDHQLGGPSSPVRLRLKTVQGGGFNTTYNYDTQNRLTTVTKADGSLRVYSYDSTGIVALMKNYPNPTDRANGTVTAYYSTGEEGSYSKARIYNLNNGIINNPIFGDSYSSIFFFGNSNRITSINRRTGMAVTGNHFIDFSYTGENIIAAKYTQFRFPDHDDTYEYDDKINPFFGMYDPDLSDVELFSRNNVTKINYVSRQSQPSYMNTYVYEYNPQGLPVKRTTTEGGNEVITYTYESY